MSRLSHSEVHMVHRIGWLRAAVLGANDGLVSTASLVVGVAAAGSGRPEILIAGLAGLVAGAMSMAAGEYTFAVGAVIPLIIAALVPAAQITLVVAVTTLVALSVLGGLGASVGGAGIVKGAIRVTFWGALAMAATAAVGMIFDVTVG